MEEEVKEIFAKQILALIKRRNIDFKNYIETGRDKKGLKVEIAVSGTNVIIRIDMKARNENHTEVEMDPRMFGDTQAVTAAAMQDWYPGKTNNWSETKITVTIEANGLPDIGTHRETYRYTDWGYKNRTQGFVENILEIIEDRRQKITRERETQDETAQVRRIQNAFEKI